MLRLALRRLPPQLCPASAARVGRMGGSRLGGSGLGGVPSAGPLSSPMGAMQPGRREEGPGEAPLPVHCEVPPFSPPEVAAAALPLGLRRWRRLEGTEAPTRAPGASRALGSAWAHWVVTGYSTSYFLQSESNACFLG